MVASNQFLIQLYRMAHVIIIQVGANSALIDATEISQWHSAVVNCERFLLTCNKKKQ